MLKAALAVVALALALPARAQTVAYDRFDGSKEVLRSTAPIVIVPVSVSAWTLTDVELSTFSDTVVIRSTYAAGRFAWSFEAGASTQATSGRGSMMSDLSNDGTYNIATIRRWGTGALRIYTLFLDTKNSAPIVHVLQGR
jgi:hypothetical protein